MSAKSDGVLMETFAWLTKRISPQPIAVQFGSDVIRLMQLKGSKLELQNAVEVAIDDITGLLEAIKTFKGKQCVACIAGNDVLIQHIRVGKQEEEKIREKLMEINSKWFDAEIRTVCSKTTGSGSSTKQELLCVGVPRTVLSRVVKYLHSADATVIAVTVPLYPSIRAFDQLYRCDRDEKITSMLIDLDEEFAMVMIAHGANCVFAHRIHLGNSTEETNWQAKKVKNFSLHSSALSNVKANFARREERTARGVVGPKETSECMEAYLVGELERCVRHHDSLFPNRVVDRVIFAGYRANDTERCAGIASSLGMSGFVADPSAWINSTSALAMGPAWTTNFGMCLRYLEVAI